MRISRRKFVRDSALCAGGVKLIPLLGSNQLNAQPAQAGAGESLHRLFLSPADDARPWVYWYAQDGNLSREGITADLEAMHRAGIRGAIWMEVNVFLPKGPYPFLTPEWRELMQHAMSEATRLGITLNMNNDGGWDGSGGPWITPELSQQMLVWSEITVEGPKTVSTRLPQPKTVRDYYNDIAVIAFPIPPGDSRRMADCSPEFTYGEERKEFDFSKLIDGNPGTVTQVPLAPESQMQFVNIDFPEPFTAQAVSIAALGAGKLGGGTVWCAVQVSDDGKNYRTIREMSVSIPVSSANFEKVSSRHYRILFKPDTASTLYLRKYTDIAVGEIELHEGPRIEDIPGKALFVRHGAYSTENDVLAGQPDFPENTVIRSGKIVDISKKMDSDGLLAWDAPPGRWIVLRVGHTSTGVENHPAPEQGMGLECDKLSKRAIEVQFNGLVKKLLQDEAAVGATAIKMSHVDSWEAGSQNWTWDFREQFQARRGYDPIPFLPILTGRAIESGAQSERFLWDLRRTIADLLLENYADHLKELCHEHGLTLSIEAYGTGPLDELAYGGRADVPMGEFWLGHGRSEIFNVSTKGMASAAHTYGRPILAAEAFTADAAHAKWQNHPYSFKPLGDLAFSWGVNRFVLNEFMMQPWADRKPGMTLGPWGTHISRGNTWWEQSRAWNTYLSRCQTVLQRGSFLADVAYLGGEGAPYSAPWTKDLDPPLPRGYDYDVLSPEILLKDATVHEGRLVLKSGMSYRLLVLQPGCTMTPALLRKIRELVHLGAAVVGPRPVSSPSLAEYPHCDVEVRQLADELWGRCDGGNIKENRFGAGRVLWGESLDDVLVKLGTPPDFDCYEAAVGEEIRFTHRNIDGDDYYFLASGVPEARTFLCTFRPGSKNARPELWWPDSGRIEPLAVFSRFVTPVGAVPAEAVNVSKISIPISLDPHGSVFVVFRAAAESESDPIETVERDGALVYGLAPVLTCQFSSNHVKPADGAGLVLETGEQGIYSFITAAGHGLRAEVPRLPSPVSIQGPWELEFPKNLGAPGHVTFDRLISWTDHPDFGVKHFSGTATYRNRFALAADMLTSNRRLYLDLGRVCVIAEVALNGKDLGILWKPPFMLDITDAAAATNELEVRVVNLWPNRLIGDEYLPDDCEWGTPGAGHDPVLKTAGLPIARWPQWLLENKPRPTARVAFTVWKHWGKDDPLLESGLLGPVRILTKAKVRLTGSPRGRV